MGSLMLTRRELFGGVVAARLGNRGALEQRESQGTQADEDMLRELRGINASLRIAVHTPADDQVAIIRERQRSHLRVSQRFPDYIDVGIRVWERLQDWHVQYMRPLNIARAGDGRWNMEFIHTTIVLRTDIAENDIGMVYDR
jgi:hypothetical protein